MFFVLFHGIFKSDVCRALWALQLNAIYKCADDTIIYQRFRKKQPWDIAVPSRFLKILSAAGTGKR